MSRPLCTINPYTLEKQFRNRETEQEASRKILIITYYWPPCGGAGVQRWLKFSKYLPEYGWEPYVVTVDPQYALFPAIDKSLEAEVHPSVRVFKTKAINWFRLFSSSVKTDHKLPGSRGETDRTIEEGEARYPGKSGSHKSHIEIANAGDSRIDKSRRESGVSGKNNNTAGMDLPHLKLMTKISRFIRGNFFIPDPRRGWNRYAFRMASKLIREEGISFIVTTSPPHSTQLIGLRLKKQFPQIKWIADFRDPWTDIFYYDMFYPTLLSDSLNRRMEKSVLREADILTAAGYFLGKSKAGEYGVDPTKIMPLLNGFDEDDFKGKEPARLPLFTITYAGAINERYPVGSFITAVKSLISDSRKVMIRFIGSADDTIINLFSNELPAVNLQFMPYADHNRVIEHMLESNMLLLVIPDHKKNKTIIPGKLFEYIRSGNPVLSIGPANSDVAVILEKTGAGMNFLPDDYEGMLKYITSVMDKQPVKKEITAGEYNRKSQIKNFLDRIEN
jgi:glycosyltransferase involved in cell wall biosynthesis